MGYTTKFDGELLFVEEPSVSQIRELKRFLGEDIRKIEPKKEHEFYYIDFELTESLNGIKWDGSEKFYGAVECVNWLTAKMREQWPSFAFTGELSAQGEDAADRWRLVVNEGVATRVENPPPGFEVECPDCGLHFYVEAKE